MDKLKDILHLYLGCRVLVRDEDGTPFTDRLESCHNDKAGLRFGIYECGDMQLEDYFNNNGSIQLILRPLSDMTQEEAGYTSPAALAGKPTILVNADITRYLLSRGFDLYGLIDEGLAIDATTVKW